MASCRGGSPQKRRVPAPASGGGTTQRTGQWNEDMGGASPGSLGARPASLSCPATASWARALAGFWRVPRFRLRLPRAAPSGLKRSRPTLAPDNTLSLDAHFTSLLSAGNPDCAFPWAYASRAKTKEPKGLPDSPGPARPARPSALRAGEASSRPGLVWPCATQSVVRWSRGAAAPGVVQDGGLEVLRAVEIWAAQDHIALGEEITAEATA